MICSCRKVLLHHRKSQLISIGRRCVSVTPFSRRAERWGCRGLPDQVNRTGPALLRSNLLDQSGGGLLLVVEHKGCQTTHHQKRWKPACSLALRCQTSRAKVGQFVRQPLQIVSPFFSSAEGRRRQAGTQSRAVSPRAPVGCMGSLVVCFPFGEETRKQRMSYAY